MSDEWIPVPDEPSRPPYPNALDLNERELRAALRLHKIDKAWAATAIGHADRCYSCDVFARRALEAAGVPELEAEVERLREDAARLSRMAAGVDVDGR